MSPEHPSSTFQGASSSMYFRRLFNRFLGIRDDAVVPAVCYATCNDAFNAAESVGLTPALCEAGSPFQVNYNDCISCIISNAGNATDVQNYTFPTFTPFVDYCAENSSDAGLLSAYNSQLSEISSLLSELATANNHTGTGSVTPATTPASSTSNTASSNPSSSSSSPNTIPEHSSHAWIAGAVIGPVVLILAIGVALFVIRRRKGTHGSPVAQEDPEEKDNKFQDKAQLHGDSIVYPQRHELDSEVSPVGASELPAHEPVGSELPHRI